MQFNAISCLYEHSLGDIMRYEHSFQLASTCEDSFIWCQNYEDNISIDIVGQFQFGISRNMSSIGILKWQQELAMDFQLKSSTSL